MIRNFYMEIFIRAYDCMQRFIRMCGRTALFPILKLKWDRRFFSHNNDEIISRMKESTNNILFVTNSAGGGTALFSSCITDNLEARWTMKIIAYTKDFYYEIGHCTYGSCLVSLEQLKEIFECFFTRIEVNSLVGCNHTFDVLSLICGYKRFHPQTEIVYYVHDYHSICPHKNLICGINYCELECSKRKCRINTPEFTYKTDILTWRSKWKAFLSMCDEVVCFDDSGRELLNKAYIDNNFNIIVRPHDKITLPYKKANMSRAIPHVGIVGNCGSVIKGKYLIYEFLCKRKKSIPVTFIGTPRKSVLGPKKNTNYISHYKREDLQSIIENEGVNIILFTSVVPETFSFVISEMMAMELPIVCLDLGAQGHRVREYRYGHVCATVDEMIREIEKIYVEKFE